MSCVHEVSQMDAEGRLGRENKVGPLMPLRASVDAQDWGLNSGELVSGFKRNKRS
jgi:hypothetical protein